MANPKLTLSASRDIPFNKLVLSQSNVRTIKTGVSIEELAEDIARRTLLQSLNVRAVVDADGAETGMFEIPAGGRRYRALELLVKQKRLAKTALVPCVVRVDGIAEEDSLAENVQRAPLHPRKVGKANGDELARAVHLDMANAGWRPTAENYLGRVPKARILEAVREAKGESAAQLMEHLKKGDMAREAERMLADTDWLPEILRLRDASIIGEVGEQEAGSEEIAEIEELPAFLADDAKAPEELDDVELGAPDTSDFAIAAE